MGPDHAGIAVDEDRRSVDRKRSPFQRMRRLGTSRSLHDEPIAGQPPVDSIETHQAGDAIAGITLNEKTANRTTEYCGVAGVGP